LARGSRIHLNGGDLDLWLEVAPGTATLANERRFRDLIAQPLDELKVDIADRSDRAPRRRAAVSAPEPAFCCAVGPPRPSVARRV
jgi:hypothetical protein